MVVLDDFSKVGKLPVASEVVPWQNVDPNDRVDAQSYQVRLVFYMRVDECNCDHDPRGPVRIVPVLIIVQTNQGISGHEVKVQGLEHDANKLDCKELLLVFLQPLGLRPLALQRLIDLSHLLLMVDHVLEVVYQ